MQDDKSAEGIQDLARRVESKATWNDLVLPPAQLEILRSIVVHVRLRTVVFDEWGFAGRAGRGPGMTALFSGASGTGKTLAAEVVANDLGLDLFVIDLSMIVNRYIGETERNLARVFDTAARSDAILLFDEADALFGKRSDVKDSHDRYANMGVSYLLSRMETYSGLAILTTNLRDVLDAAFVRRLRFVVEFPFPDRQARKAIFRRSFPPGAPLGDIDYSKLAELEVSGHEISAIALGAAFAAAADGSPIEMRHVEAASRAELAKHELIRDWGLS